MSTNNKVMKALSKRLRCHIEADSSAIDGAGCIEEGYTRSIRNKPPGVEDGVDIVLTTKFNDVDAMFVTLVVLDAGYYFTVYCDMHYTDITCTEHCISELCDQLCLSPQELYDELQDSSDLQQVTL